MSPRTRPPFPLGRRHRAPRAACGGALVAALLLLVAACGERSEATTGRFFHEVGPDGALLSLEEPPRRVLPANLHAAELLAALVPRERFAGIPGTAFEFGGGFGTRADWEAGGEARVLRRYRGEDVLALRPDLVVSGAYQDLATTALLRRSGVPVLGLPTVRRLEDVEQGLVLLGRILDRRARADEVVATMRERRARLAERSARWRGSEGLVYTNYGTGGWTQGTKSPAEVLLSLAGLVNAASLGELRGHYQIDVEQLVALDPDVIVCGAAVAELGASARILSEHPLLRTLTAVREARVVTLPADLFQTSSQRLLDAAEALVERLEALGLGDGEGASPGAAPDGPGPKEGAGRAGGR